MNKNMIREFYRNKVCFITFALLLLFLNIYFGVEIKNYFMHYSSMFVLKSTQNLDIIILITFIFISYEYNIKNKQNKIYEVISSIDKGLVKLYVSKFTIVFVALVIIFLNFIIINLVIYFFNEEKNIGFLFHILLCNILNILLTGVVGILIGMFVSLRFNRIKGYALITILIFLFSPLLENINYNLLMGYNINIYPYTDIFKILTPNMTWMEDSLYGVSIEAYRWNRIFSWIIVFSIMITSSIIIKKSIKVKLMSFVLSVFAITNIILSYDIGGAVMKDYRPNGFRVMDQTYYSKFEVENEPAKFKVSNYDINLKIGRELDAEISMDLNNYDNIRNLDFTLYRGYSVNKVYNESQENLTFKQNGDYLNIDLGNSNTQKITIEYSGSSPVYYSTSQGVFLPGYFAYYPMPGVKEVYDFYSRSYVTNCLEEEVDFKVAVTGIDNVYSNLSGQDKKFEGRSNALTLVGGFATMEEYEDMKLVNVFGEPITAEEIEQITYELDELNRIIGLSEKLNSETIIRIPIANSAQQGVDLATNFTDHIMISTNMPKVLAVKHITNSLIKSNENEIEVRVFESYVLDEDKFTSSTKSVESILNMESENISEDNKNYIEALNYELKIRTEILKLEKELGREGVIKKVYWDLKSK